MFKMKLMGRMLKIITISFKKPIWSEREESKTSY